MSSSELTSLSITELEGILSRREVSPVEVTGAYLERIEHLNPRLDAYIAIDSARALAAARDVEREIRAGRHRGPLHGVPVAVKDLFLVAGMPRTCGSRIMAHDIASRDATSVARLRAAGAVILGTLNLHEFAYGPTGINPHHGTARNPWAPDRVCGGSSSGSACAVAASLAAGTLGTDTGGSIRIPAALCGVVGLKQTYGLASRHGIYPVCEDLDHGGPLAKTVADVAVLLQAIAGEDRNDPSTRFASTSAYGTGLGRGLEDLRIGVPSEYFFDDLHPEVETAVRNALAMMEDLGASLVSIDVPFAEQATDAWTTISAAEAYVVHRTHIEENPRVLSPDVEARLVLGRNISAQALVRARWVRTEVNREMARLLEAVDLLGMPTVPIPAVRVADAAIEVGGRTVEGAKVLGRLTRLAALTGQPAVSLPCGFTSDGMPIGLQLIGGWFDEARLLATAYAYEQAAGWHRRRPPGLGDASATAASGYLPPQQ